MVVSAGLAVGVFCGLLFGLGAYKPADARPVTATDAAGDELARAIRAAVEASRASTQLPVLVLVPVPVPVAGDARGSGSAVETVGSGFGSAVATGSATGSGAAAATGSANGSGSATGAGTAVDATQLGAGSGSASPVVASPTATIEFDVSPTDAVITVDSVKVTSPTHLVVLDGGKGRVRIQATASGYRSYDEMVTVSVDQVIKIRMTKRKKTTGGGGLMDPF